MVMKKVKKLVFATNNQHKLEEARQIISNDFEIISLAEIGCHDDIPETADTLEGNALQKARWINERYGYDCFADDTGLMVDALDGAPGVYSARYAGENCTPADNVAKLLKAMEHEDNRDARFATVVALISDGETHTFEGSVEGNISRQPHGNGGFGYDPVFIEKESGKCFAEMTADEKNAVSHRGRAMRKLRDFLGVFILMLLSMVSTFQAEGAQWRLHPSYDGQILRIADTPDYVYFFGTKQTYNPLDSKAQQLNGIIFRYDKKGEEIIDLNPQNLLSDNTVKTAAYNYDGKFLAVALEDGTIDFIFDDGTVKTIRGLKVADSSLIKNINDFTFDKASGKAYAATDFGFLVIDTKKNEIETSRIFDKKINSAAIFNDLLWLGCEDGIYYGNPSDFNMSEFKHIMPGKNVEMLSPVGGKMYFFTGYNYNSILIHSLEIDGAGNPSTRQLSTENEISFQRGRNAVMSNSHSKLRFIDETGKTSFYELPSGYTDSSAGSLDGKTFWISSKRKGISNLKAPDESGKWTVLKDRFLPNASSAFMCMGMAYNPEYGMLVRNHGYESPFAAGIVTTNDLISGYKGMNWTRLSSTYRTDMKGLLIDSPFGLAVDPNNPDHVYCGSERSGFLRLDLKNPEKSIHFSKATDFLGGYGEPGFAVVVPDNPPGTWEAQCVFAAPGFDNYGNLWTAFVNPEADGDVSKYTELWVWPSAARAATTGANNVQGWKKIKIADIPSGNWPVMLPLKTGANKNIVLHMGNNLSAPMIIYNHGGTIDNLSDDKMQTMKSIYDQDGISISFGRAHAMYEDPATGLVWVSYGSGLFTFNPVEAMTNPTAVRRIKVPRHDGTNAADYLLDGVRVNSITSDNTGRKWFGTTGAGLVCTSADGLSILATYTPDNSELPGNDVYGVCYNPSSNSMMISTDKGLCELFLNGSSDSSDSGVKAYPNPVRPDYYGYVTIEGLEQDAMVKIVDTAGNLIKEVGQSYNGTIEWDVTNIFSKRVPGGVYFVVASNGPNADSYNKVAKILVVD